MLFSLLIIISFALVNSVILWDKSIEKLTIEFDGENMLEDRKTQSFKDFYKFIDRKKTLDIMIKENRKSEEIEWYNEKLEKQYYKLVKKYLHVNAAKRVILIKSEN